MKKSITMQLLVLAFVGICFISFIPAIYAHGPKEANVAYRPIEDFLEKNDFLISNYVAWMDADPTLYLAVHNEWDTGETISDCIYHGYVRETVLEDGWIEFYVDMIVLGANVQVYYIEGVWWPLIFEGKMNYYMHFVFRAQQEPGATIPYLWIQSIVDEDIMSGIGVGKFTEEASDFGFRPGKPGVVKIYQAAENGIYYEEDLYFLQ